MTVSFIMWFDFMKCLIFSGRMFLFVVLTAFVLFVCGLVVCDMFSLLVIKLNYCLGHYVVYELVLMYVKTCCVDVSSCLNGCTRLHMHPQLNMDMYVPRVAKRLKLVYD